METSIGRETKEWAKGRTWDHLMKLTDGETVNGPGSDGESLHLEGLQRRSSSRAAGNHGTVYAEK